MAEQRAQEKAGFTREGILRGTTFRQGRCTTRCFQRAA